jgi:DNA-binding MarR family transcriptional regulator
VSDNPIKVLEKQSGLIRLLIYLHDRPPVNVQSIVDNSDIYPNIMYASIKKAKDLKLIEDKIDDTKYPPRTMLSLTEKGKPVAQKLKEIEEILKEGVG